MQQHVLPHNGIIPLYEAIKQEITSSAILMGGGDVEQM